MNILYIHGFRSSGDSDKARQMQVRFPEATVVSPTLSANPDEAVGQLEGILRSLSGKTLIVGTSLGGFYALYLSCRYGYACCAINPAWQAHLTLRRKVGCHTRYDSDEIYDFRPEYPDRLAEMREAMLRADRNPEALNFFLSNDDEELSFEGLEEIFPQYRLLRRFDASGHRFSRFPEILGDVEEIVANLPDAHIPDLTKQAP
jgi:predicted esterase YcpF (UPF0227 family)